MCVYVYAFSHRFPSSFSVRVVVMGKEDLWFW